MNVRARSRRPSDSGPTWLMVRVSVIAALVLFPLGFFYLTALFVWPAILIVCLFLRRLFHEPAKRVTSGAYGEAAFASRAELKEAGMLAGNGLLVGSLPPLSPPFLPALRDLHFAPWDGSSKEVTSRFVSSLLGRRYGPRQRVYVNDSFATTVIGPPGSGKSAAVVIPALLTCQKSMVVLDPKGECFQISHRHRRGVFGQRVVRFDPFKVCGESGDTFNPLSILDPHSLHVVDECRLVAEALVVKNPHTTDPHWDEQATNCLTAFCLYTVLYAPVEQRNLNTVAELVTDPKEFAAAVSLMCDRNGTLAQNFGRTATYECLRRYGASLSALQDKELSSVLSTLGRHLNWCISPLMQRALSATSFDPIDLVRGKATLHLILPPDKLESHSRLLRLWLTACTRALVRAGLQQNGNEVLFMLDEVGNVGPLKVLREGITVLRGYGARWVYILQSTNQYKEIFGEAADTVKAGFDTLVGFGIRDQATAEEFSKLLGQTTVISRSGGTTTTSTRNTGTGQSGGSYSSGSSQNWSEVGRALMMAHEIRGASPRTVFILSSGKSPVVAEQVRYYEDPEMAAAASAAEPEAPTASDAGTAFPGECHPTPALPGEPVTDWAAITHPERPRLPPLSEDVDWGMITSGRPTLPPSPSQTPAPEPARIKFACPCGKRFNLAQKLAGKRAKCTNPRCTRTFRIPMSGGRGPTRTTQAT